MLTINNSADRWTTDGRRTDWRSVGGLKLSRGRPYRWCDPTTRLAGHHGGVWHGRIKITSQPNILNYLYTLSQCAFELCGEHRTSPSMNTKKTNDTRTTLLLGVYRRRRLDENATKTKTRWRLDEKTDFTLSQKKRSRIWIEPSIHFYPRRNRIESPLRPTFQYILVVSRRNFALKGAEITKTHVPQFQNPLGTISDLGLIDWS